jgi:hypothetical protein
MSNQVFANMMEVSCKSANGKSICAFPDVCFTPPTTPATPPGVPIPYPNTGMASDTTSGSTSVKISGKEVMLKDKSYFKKSTGDEAGAAPKKGIVTSVNRGKVYFAAWSMDVKAEGENVVRHLDITTHNHASKPPNPPPMAHVDDMSAAVKKACAGEIKRGRAACKGQSTRKCSPECKAKQKCLLVPKGKDKKICCKPDTTGDHLIEDHWVLKSKKPRKLMPDFAHLKGKPGGSYKGAPTMCANRSRFKKLHGIGHGSRGVREDEEIGKRGAFRYSRGKQIALEGAADQCAYVKEQTGADPQCTKDCLEAQLDAFYGADGQKEMSKPVRRQALKKQQRADAKARRKPKKRTGRGG